ncbi:MAG: alkaline shock response membrane anchor protein AmaP [Candidatus Acetothermia bacterium]
MDTLRNRFVDVFYVLLAFIWFFIAAGFIGYAYGFFPEYDLQAFLGGRPGTLLLYAIGALSGFVGLYFVRKFVVSYTRQRTFVHEGDLGNIHISRHAVKELTDEILRVDLDLKSFRTKLTQSGGGVSIEVNAKVGSEDDIGELGEKVQETLREKVHERTGLNVERIDFYTRGVESSDIKDSSTKTEVEGPEEIEFEGDEDEN